MSKFIQRPNETIVSWWKSCFHAMELNLLNAIQDDLTAWEELYSMGYETVPLTMINDQIIWAGESGFLETIQEEIIKMMRENIIEWAKTQLRENEKWVDSTFNFSDPNTISVEKDLDLSNQTQLISLPEKLSVGGDLKLTGCTQLKSFPKIFSVEGAVWLDDSQTELIRLSKLLEDQPEEKKDHENNADTLEKEDLSDQEETSSSLFIRFIEWFQNLEKKYQIILVIAVILLGIWIF